MEESQIERVSIALLDAAIDKDSGVQEQAFKSLCEMGKHHPSRVLQMCYTYLLNHSKLAQGHRIIILQTMETVVKDKINNIDQVCAKNVISLASDEMTKSKEVIPEWQQAASNVLVAVGVRFINEVMEEILTKFQPGILPHFFIVQTMAQLSTANVFGMVPFLNPILGTMLPMLGMAKQDSMKWAFSVALLHFSESILEYLANLENAPDPTVRRDTFSNEIYAAYDVLFNVWLQSRDTKLRLAVVEALGPVSQLMPHDKLEEQLPRLIPGILSLYKKHPEPFYITKGLCQVLDASVNLGSRFLETQLDSLLNTLHPQVCHVTDLSNPLTLKNYNEVLRCFTVLARAFPDRLINFILPKLDSNNERLRVGSLAVMRHLVNSASAQMETKKALILASVKILLHDNSNKVKRMIIQVISAMAHHSYLKQDGGEIMVEYIVRHCCNFGDNIPKRHSSDVEDVSDESIQNMCENTLFLLTTTVEGMTDVLWPYLLEFVAPVYYTGALPAVCKSLIFLGTKKQEAESDNFMIDFNAHANLPKPSVILARLLVVSAFPYQGQGRGIPALRLLQTLSSNIHPSLAITWDSQIPLLVQHLEENTAETLLQKPWEDKLLRFLSVSLEAIAEDKWTCQLAIDLTKHLQGYNCFPHEKGFLYKCVGVVLRQCKSKDTVKMQLQELLALARYNEEIEREGLAVGVGFSSSSHLDTTLGKLEDFAKSDVFKKTAGIFNILKDKNDVDIEKLKSALILCYGYIALHAPDNLILSRIETDILRNMVHHFNTKDMTLKLSMIKGISLIAQAIDSNKDKCSFTFSRKVELVKYMLEFIKAEPLDSLKTAIRLNALTACRYLVNLQPPLSETDNFELISSCLNNIFCLPPVEQEKRREERASEIGDKESLYDQTMTALQNLLNSILLQDLSPDGLQTVFKHIEGWLTSPREWERERAIVSTFFLLKFYLKKLNIRTVVSFHNLGALIGRLAPRCSDPSLIVRQSAIDCLYTLLCIQLRYEGFALDYKDELVENLNKLRGDLDHPDPTILFHTCSEIAQVIGKRLPHTQVNTLLFMLFEGLVDAQRDCARTASVLINSLVKGRGNGLQEQVLEILEVLYIQLQAIAEDHVKHSVTHTVYLLASQHSTSVLSCLLTYPLPYDSYTCSMWKALAVNTTIATKSMELLLDRLSKHLPYEEKKESILRNSPKRYATVQPLAVTCALNEIMSEKESKEAVVGLYPQLLSALLVRIGCSVGLQLPKDFTSSQKDRKTSIHGRSAKTFDVCSCAVDALQTMLRRGGSKEVVKAVEAEGGWEMMKVPEKHHDGVSLLARAMTKFAGPRIPGIVETLNPLLSSIYENQRITVIAFFAELLSNHVVSELMLLDVVLHSIMGKLVDSSCTVRMLAIRGLGNIAIGSPEKVKKYSTKLLAAMTSGMDEKEDPNDLITLEAMSGLSKILLKVEERDIRDILIHISLRIRPFFENEKERIRTSAFTLFGNLSRFGHGESKEIFQDQIHNAMISLLLHLNDPNADVIKACKFALRMNAPVLGSELVTEMFQRHLHEDKGLHYGEFMNDLSKHLIKDFLDKLNCYIVTTLSFFKSSWAEIRGNAAMFAGFIIANLPEENSSCVDLERLCISLAVLLKDPVPFVRMKAAEALGYFYRF
ncbi:maestro heat-like repeat-containing protein family member 1 isoform X2 [Protopterus annectens]|uniref:maestro heat-like repeat-containing protein family member 1 isoform X2 n=1 Tax=Protopterus annectens TaxID=7888 RepID=UPI001CFB8B5B|nr:maestro heat-like repeat-containing protein family member 1 isoform X2 [Protopterus annectens]